MRKEVSIQHVDLHQQVVKVREKERKKWGKKSKNEAVNYHLDKKIPLNECIFRHGSEGHLKFINDVRDFVNESELYVNHDERELLRTDLGSYGIYEGEKVPLDLPMINEAEYRGKKSYP